MNPQSHSPAFADLPIAKTPRHFAIVKAAVFGSIVQILFASIVAQILFMLCAYYVDIQSLTPQQFWVTFGLFIFFGYLQVMKKAGDCFRSKRKYSFIERELTKKLRKEGIEPHALFGDPVYFSEFNRFFLGFIAFIWFGFFIFGQSPLLRGIAPQHPAISIVDMFFLGPFFLIAAHYYTIVFLLWVTSKNSKTNLPKILRTDSTQLQVYTTTVTGNSAQLQVYAEAHQTQYEVKLPLGDASRSGDSVKGFRYSKWLSKYFEHNDAHPSEVLIFLVLLALGGLCLYVLYLFPLDNVVGHAPKIILLIGALLLTLFEVSGFEPYWRTVRYLIGKFFRPYRYVNALQLQVLSQSPEFHATNDDYMRRWYTGNAKAAELRPIAKKFQFLAHRQYSFTSLELTAEQRIALRGDLIKLIRLFQQAAHQWQNERNNQAQVVLTEDMQLFDEAAEYATLQRSLLDSYKPPVTYSEKIPFEMMSGGVMVTRDENDQVLSVIIVAPPNTYHINYEPVQGLAMDLLDVTIKTAGDKAEINLSFVAPVYDGSLVILPHDNQFQCERILLTKRPRF